MTKKKRERKERARERERREKTALRREPEEIDDFPGFPLDPRAMERMIARMGRIMAEQQFESMDEAQAFMNNYLSEGRRFAGGRSSAYNAAGAGPGANL